MSEIYLLACEESRMKLCLGKVVKFDEQMNRIPMQFDGFFDDKTEQWTSRQGFLLAIERFLLINHGKSIRVVVDSEFLNLDSDNPDEWTSIDSLEQLMAMEVPFE